MNYNEYDNYHGEGDHRGFKKIKNTTKQKKKSYKEDIQKKKNYYVIEKGRITGIVKDKDVAEYSIKGFKGATYKRFEKYNEALEYTKKKNESAQSHKKYFEQSKEVIETMGYDTFFYVDGSNFERLSKSTSGYVLMKNENVIAQDINVFVSKEDNTSTEAELRSAMLAIIEAKRRGLNQFVIVFDCLDIIEFYLKKTKNNDLANSYYNWMKQETEGMDIVFLKAKSHVGIKGNELVDKLVSSALFKSKKKKKKQA